VLVYSCDNLNGAPNTPQLGAARKLASRERYRWHARMSYRIIYHVGDEVTLKTKVASGVLCLDADSVNISGDTSFLVPYSDIRTVAMFRLNGLGRMLKLVCSDRTLFISVTRLNLFGYFAIINFFKTGRLCEELNARIPKR